MAIPVQAILTGVSIATTAIQMFGPSGPSLGNLMALQTEMLKAISAQLSLIQSGITLILKDLNDIKKELDLMPEKTASAIYEINLRGILSAYEELMEGYINEQAIRGIDSASRIFGARIKDEMLKLVFEARNTLMTFDDPFHIPLISFALQVEVQGMIIVGDEFYPNTAIKAALNRYAKWLKNILSEENEYGVPVRMKTEREKYKALIEDADNLHIYQCCRSFFLKEESGQDYADIICNKYKYLPSLLLNGEQLEKVNDLIIKNILATNDLPMRLVQSSTPEKTATIRVNAVAPYLDYHTVIYYYDPVPEFYPEDIKPEILFNIPNCGQGELWSSKPNSLQKISDEMERIGYTLLTLSSLQATGLEALNGIDKFLADPLLN